MPVLLQCFLGSEGCHVPPENCDNSLFGCCPDGTAATGPELAGCEGVVIKPGSDCTTSNFGCCADDKTPALGPNEEGCNSTEVEVLGNFLGFL